MPFKKGESGNPGGRWKPGQSGNPGGRPKTKKFREAIERQLALRATKENPDQGYDDMAAAMIARIDAHGDVAAWKELRDTIDGKVPTPIGGTDELPAIRGFSWIDPTQEDQTPVSDNAALEGDSSEDSLH